jgi:hypothetical protein
MPTQKEFEEKVEKFPRLEPARDQFYFMALNLLKRGYELEAYILILATWNFAGFRYILTHFNLDSFRKTINEINPLFESLDSQNFRDANFEDATLCEDIKKIYDKLRVVVKQTGASKIMHLRNPNLFVMWDTGIRSILKIKNRASPEDYISFLKKMKTRFGSIQWEDRERTFAKAIDQYNYVEVQESKKK